MADQKVTRFPDYDAHFGKFVGMIKHVEIEVGIKHLFPRKIEPKDREDINEKNLKAQKHQDYPKENQFLLKVLSLLKVKTDENKKEYYDQLNEVIRRGNRVAGMDTWSDDPVMKAKITAKWTAQNLNQYRRSQNSPFFGKILFKRKGSSEPMELYFGKAAVDLEGVKERVIDWRAPIADLYYKYTGSVRNASFNVERNEIKGDIELKRQISIEEGLITMISDGNLNEAIKDLEDAVVQEDSSDEILVTNLDKSAHKRLGEIVATIQAEQNAIIRAPMDKVTLVQGVAGAGKTTIALHRLAYLMYNNPDEMRPDRVMVIAPNNIFLDYISGILPDLGVESIIQTTIENFLRERYKLPKEMKFMNKMEVSAKSYENEDFANEVALMDKLKGDLRVLKLVKNLKQILEKQIVRQLSETPYYPIHAHKIDYNFIRSLFYDYRSKPWIQRIEYIIQKGETIIKNEIDSNSINRASANERKKVELANFRKYINQVSYPSIIETYRLLLNPEAIQDIFTGLLEDEIVEIISKINEYLDEGIVMSDDLPILFKISELYNEKKINEYDYVVVDEAQDLSPLELQVLKENTKENALCIVGDINQTIHSEGKYTTIVNQIGEVFGENSLEFHNLLKSYRSTIEITDHANKILEQLSSPHIATPVIRHGVPPTVQNIARERSSSEIAQIVENTRGRGRKSIVITTRTEATAKELFRNLESKIPDLSYISEEKKDYNIGVHIMPSYLTKGLEFDTVIVVEDNEKKKSDRELRLQYVMYTRALHELYVINQGRK